MKKTITPATNNSLKFTWVLKDCALLVYICKNNLANFWFETLEMAVEKSIKYYFFKKEHMNIWNCMTQQHKSPPSFLFSKTECLISKAESTTKKTITKVKSVVTDLILEITFINAPNLSSKHQANSSKPIKTHSPKPVFLDGLSEKQKPTSQLKIAQHQKWNLETAHSFTTPIQPQPFSLIAFLWEQNLDKELLSPCCIQMK